MTTLRTPLCELFGIDIPIFNVGFGQSATPSSPRLSQTPGAAVFSASPEAACHLKKSARGSTAHGR